MKTNIAITKPFTDQNLYMVHIVPDENRDAANFRRVLGKFWIEPTLYTIPALSNLVKITIFTGLEELVTGYYVDSFDTAVSMFIQELEMSDNDIQIMSIVKDLNRDSDAI